MSSTYIKAGFEGPKIASKIRSAPTFSIVTIAFNNPEELEETIKSVSSQSFTDFEFIIVDGSTSDKTEYLVGDYRNQVDLWIREPDRGIYDAMNKGINLAKGDWITFLNSGDVYSDGLLLSRLYGLMKEKDAVYFGSSLNIFPSGRSYLYPDFTYSGSNQYSWVRNNLPNHQAMFFPRRFYESNRYFVNLRISSDKEYKIRAFRKCRYFGLPVTVVKFGVVGVSSRIGELNVLLTLLKEEVFIWFRHGNLYGCCKSIVTHIVKFFLK